MIEQYLQPAPNLVEGVPAIVERDNEVLQARTEILDLLPANLASPEVLDIGPAMGWEMIQIQRRYKAVVQVVTLFEQEATRLRALSGSPVHVGDLHNLPETWADRFGGVVASHVIEHSPAPYIALREMHRVLCPGGWVFLVSPEPAGAVGIGNPERFCRSDMMADHIYLPGIGDLIALMRRAGLRFDRYLEVAQYTLGRLAYWHRVWIGTKP